MLRINNILPNSRANGPGNRYTIWVQGCSIQCKGCTNTHTWPFGGGEEISIDTILEDIRSDSGLDGVTITGGEPLDQYPEVLKLCRKLNLITSVFITTGYTMQQIVEKGFFEIVSTIDILCSGPFIENLECTGEWRGSSNQVLYFLTELGIRQSDMPIIEREIYIDKEGNARETGFTGWHNKLNIQSTPNTKKNIFYQHVDGLIRHLHS